LDSSVSREIRLGCLKSLGHLYRRKDVKNLSACQRVLMDASKMQPYNISIWYNLGLVSKEVKDYRIAYESFVNGLKCSNWHPGCMHNLAILSYVLGNPLAALYFAMRGIENVRLRIVPLKFVDNMWN